VIVEIPLITGEFGENDCADDYIDQLTDWLHTWHVSYLAWSWTADFACASGPALITSYAGTLPPTGKDTNTS
jgi:endoglucanase